MAANPELQSMTLQKTKDGETYTDLQNFIATDNEQQSHVYAALDSNTGEETIFYRVKLILKNGQTAYSAIATVFRKGAPLPLVAFPNPVTNQEFYLRTEAAPTEVQCALYDNSGREHSILVLEKEVNGLLTVQPVYHLPSGKYILKITNASKVSTQNIVFY